VEINRNSGYELRRTHHRPPEPLVSTIRFSLPALAALCVLSACGSDPVSDGSGGPATLADSGTQSDIDLSGPDALAPDDDTTPGDVAEPDTQTAPDVIVEDVTPTPDIVATPDVAPPPVDIGTPDTPGLPTNPVDPYIDGIYSVSTTEVRVPDSTGTDRAAVLYVPDSVELPDLPAIVFSHGFQLGGSSYAGYAERMASHGIIVLLPTWGDTLLASRNHVDLANDVETMISWLIQQNGPGGEFEGRLNLLGLGAAGHSRGGKQSILAAVNDERIQALFTLDPVDSAPPGPFNDPADYPSVTPEQMDGITIPFGVVGAGLGATTTIPFAPACAPAEDNYQAYFNEVGTDSYLYTVADAGHNDFLFNCTGFACQACPGGDDAEFLRDLSAGQMTAFFRLYLAGDERYEAFLSGGMLDTWVAEGKLDYRTR
jgi:predicted dienelactone hydrolase